MGIIVTLRDDANRNEWMSRAIANGLIFNEFPALEHVFEITNLEDIDLAQWPELLDVEPSDKKMSPSLQTLNFAVGWVGANWGLMRHTSRNLPWPNSGLRLPISSEFVCARSGKGVDIYIIDSGVEVNHPEFTGRATILIEHEDTFGIGDNQGHGTAVAACAAGDTIGFARDALIWSCKCLDGATNSGLLSNILAAINAAITHSNGRSRPSVMNISISGPSSSLGSAISSASSVGITVVVAAGNDASNLDSASYNAYPAESPYSITVAALSPNDSPANFTNYGTRVDIAAGGYLIYTANLRSTGQSYSVWNGTSFSSPLVAGAIACVLEDYEKPTTSNQTQQIKNYIREQATWGKISKSTKISTLPNAILYLDPTTTYPTISGLTEHGPRATLGLSEVADSCLSSGIVS